MYVHTQYIHTYILKVFLLCSPRKMSWFGSKPSPKGIIRPSVSGTLTHWSWSAAASLKGEATAKKRNRGDVESHHQSPPTLHSSALSDTLITLGAGKACRVSFCIIMSFLKSRVSHHWWRYLAVNFQEHKLHILIYTGGCFFFSFLFFPQPWREEMMVD